MPIRLSGLNSGLDTDSIISELVKAKSVKKETMEKDQKKLSWKQDSWKALNTKIYNLYSKTLDSMRLSGSYTKRTANVSNSNAVSVIAGDGAVNSVQKLKISQLAQTGYLTGAKLEGTTPYTKETKLSDIGLSFAEGETKSITVMAEGVATQIDITSDTTIEQFTANMQKAGVNASFDEKNQRFFISSKSTGKEADFSLLASSAAGNEVLNALGIKSSITLDTNTRELYTTLNSIKGATAEETVANLKDPANKKANYILQTTSLSRAKGYKASVESLEKEITDQNKKLDELNKKIAESEEEGSVYTDEDKTAMQKEKESLEAEITKLTEQKTTEETYYTVDDKGVVSATDALIDKVAGSLVATIDYAATALSDTSASNATRIIGQDSRITLNGAEFTSDTNTYEINGLTITAKQVTGDEDITITTADDTDGIYNMIKNFLKEYNTLINEMDKLYNADSASKYTMLSDEEKEAMSEDDIKEWETKIKDSLLRKDSTLSTVSGAMKQIMLQGVTMSDGSTAYFNEFGIGTLSYFNAAENEKNAYHIDGDADDTNTSNQTDKLKSMIASNPDKVTEFFSSLSRSLYSKLNELMASTDYSSAYTVYNDKQMKKEYSNYTSKISDQEKLVADYEDRYYKKFTAMETAMSKMNSQQSALTKLFGG